MLEVEFCLMFYLFCDASSYQKVISWNLHASTDRFAKSPPDLRPNISCGQSKISRVGREGNAGELVKNHGRSIFFGILSLFVKNPNASWWQEFVHPKNLHCSNTFLPWNALKIATKFWRGSWLNDLEPPCYLSIFFIFFTENGGEKQRRGFTTSHLVWPLGLQLGSQPTTPRVCLPRLDDAPKSWEWNCGVFLFGRGKLFSTNLSHPLTFFSSADFGKSWKKYFKNLSTSFRICFTQVVKIVVLLSLGSRGLKPNLFKNHISF